MSYDKFPELPPIDFENNMPSALGPCSPEVRLASNWILAIDSWDFCDSKPLDLMLRKHPIPMELRGIIADIISGIRKQNKKAAAKLKVPAAHRLLIAGIYRMLKHEVINAVLGGKTFPTYFETADLLGVEVIDLRRRYQESAKKFKIKMAVHMGISEESLDKIVESLEEKIKNYPNI